MIRLGKRKYEVMEKLNLNESTFYRRKKKFNN